jgi:hypothetical protein
MNAARPEADTEYSRGPGGSGKPFRRSRGSGREPRTGPPIPIARALLIGGAAGSALLVVAEFTPLLHVHSSAGRGVIETVSTGSHNSYALLPVGALAALFTFVIWRTGSRLALLATGCLGLLALLIALLGDLPDARASGLIGHVATGFAIARATPGTGFYLETLGAIVLLVVAGGGLLLLGPAVVRARSAPPAGTAETRSGN